VRYGFTIILVGAALFALSVSERVPAALGIVAWGIAGLGMGLAYAPLSLTVLGEATPGQEGAATAALQLSDVLGIALGTGAAGALVAFGEDAAWLPRSALIVVFVMTIVVAGFGALLSSRLPGEVHAPASTSVAA
jgi:MFS family permease